MAKAAKIVIGALVLTPVLYVAACSAVSNLRDQGFAKVRPGDREPQVIAAMGEPADREVANSMGHDHGAVACIAPCAQRLWYRNNLGLAGEAWFIDLDESGRVLHTAHLISP